LKEDVLPEAKSNLIDLMKQRGEISVDDGSEKLGLAKTTIRQHLIALESMGFVETRSQRHGRGRPRKLYSLSEKADEFFERREREFLVGLVEFLVDHGHEDLVNQYIEHLADELRDGLDVSHLDPRSRLEALEDLATRQGFMAKIVEREDATTLEFRNCPFYQVAEINDYFCQMEHQHIDDILGQKVERIEHRLDGDTICTYCIGGTKDESS
jgi:predicted ArsR family transcriptional regulator